MIKEAGSTGLQKWDEALISAAGHILQSQFWGAFKSDFGWKEKYFVFTRQQMSTPVLILEKKLPLGKIWYCPKGPAISNVDHKGWEDFTKEIRELAQKAKVFAVKIEPELEESAENLQLLEPKGWKQSLWHVQFKATIWVDLKKSQDDLLASFKPKTRYNIRLAEKRGVRVVELPGEEAVKNLYQLMASTQKRAGFFLRPRRYFAGYWQRALDQGYGKIMFAQYNGEILSGVFLFRFGSRMWYKDGGSSNQHRELMAPYLLQWEAMKWGMQNKVTEYDLVAVPSPGELNDTKHPLHGLYRFKSGFNDKITEYVGTLDLIIDPKRYELWQKGERYYNFMYQKLKRDLIY